MGLKNSRIQSTASNRAKSAAEPSKSLDPPELTTLIEALTAVPEDSDGRQGVRTNDIAAALGWSVRRTSVALTRLHGAGRLGVFERPIIARHGRHVPVPFYYLKE